MKLTVDRQEKKGPFGGTYYETYIKVTLTPEEEQAAQKLDCMRMVLVGLDGTQNQQEGMMVGVLCDGTLTITMNTLTDGIKAKANNDSELNRLAWFENTVRAKCKEFKQILENYLHNKESIKRGRIEEEI